jgi:hypothetical protein
MRYLLANLMIVCFVACEKQEDKFTLKSSEDPLIGHWSDQEYRDTIEIFTRKSSLPENEFGFSILPDGTILERKNSGWCGTPPVSYGDFIGTWTRENDSVLAVEVDYWGGKMKYKMEILKLSETKLEVRKFEFVFPENPID